MQSTLPQVVAQQPGHQQFDFFMDRPDPQPVQPTQPQETKKPASSAIVVLHPIAVTKKSEQTKRERKIHPTAFAATVYELMPLKAQADNDRLAKQTSEVEDENAYYPVDDEAAVKRAQHAFAMMQSPATVDVDFAPDQAPTPDVFTVKSSDTDEIRLAKGMFSRMIYDMMIIAVPPRSRSEKGPVGHKQGPDFFGQNKVTKKKSDLGDMRKFDALIWMFSLNPEKPLITFEWVCEALQLDVERLRQITARNTRKELTQVIRYLAGMVDPLYAKYRAEQLGQYINLANWQVL